MGSVTFREAWAQRAYLEPTAMKTLINDLMTTKKPIETLIPIIASQPQKTSNAFWEKIKLFFWLISGSNRKNFMDAVSKTNAVATKAISELQDLRALSETIKQYKALKLACAGDDSAVNWLKPKAYFAKFKQEKAAHLTKLSELDADLAKKGFDVRVINLETELANQQRKIDVATQRLQFLSQTFFTQKNGVVASDIRQALQVEPAKTVMLNDIAKFINPDLKDVWELLFKKFETKLADPNLIKSWDCDPSGDFVLTLNKPLRMWVPSTNEAGKEDPVGGVILMLGDDKMQLKGKLTSRANKTGSMKFDDGFYCYVEQKPFGRRRPNIFTLDYNSKENVQFGAGIYIPLFGKIERQRTKSIENLKTNWAKNGEVMAVGDQAALDAKLSEKIAKAKPA